MVSGINWVQIKEWDKKYLIHANIRDDEYGTVFVDRTEGNYLITPEGRRLLDFCNQLVCVNAGQNVPEIQNAIKDALDRFWFVWDIYTTNYKAVTFTLNFPWIAQVVFFDNFLVSYGTWIFLVGYIISKRIWIWRRKFSLIKKTVYVLLDKSFEMNHCKCQQQHLRQSQSVSN